MKDIIDSLKIRLNSPLIISFLISWPIWNWQIFVSLIWYTSKNLDDKTEFQTYFDLINHYGNWYVSFFYPLISAIAYTFFFPLIKWGIAAFNAFISTKENNQIIKITEEAYVPTELFLQKNKEAN